jgi:hypothetical protein
MPQDAKHDGVLDRTIGAFQYEAVHDRRGGFALGAADYLEGDVSHVVVQFCVTEASEFGFASSRSGGEKPSPFVSDPGRCASSRCSRIGADEAGTEEFMSCDVVAETAVDEQVGGAAAQRLAPPRFDSS